MGCLYKMFPVEGFLDLQAIDLDGAREALKNVHSGASLLSGWIPLDFVWCSGSKKSDAYPDACPTYLSSWVVNGAFVDCFCDVAEDCVEFLPVSVEGSAWFVLNCLKKVSSYEKGQSIVYISPYSEEIFLVQWLVISNDALGKADIFTLAGSNNSVFFVTDKIKSAIESSGICGVGFKVIGQVV